MKLGVLISSGGSAFEQIARITRHSDVNFTVITDRECGAEAVAYRAKANHIRIEDKTKPTFCAKVATTLHEEEVDSLLLFFDRLISRELFVSVDTYNIHPAALPAFKGLDGVQDAYNARVRLLGCSLHWVDETIDGGELVAQIACGADPEWPITRWRKRAYLMKIFCGLIWVNKSTRKVSLKAPVNASHGIPEKWMASFQELQAREGEVVV